MSLILRHIAHYDKINAFVILLKPNQGKQNNQFCYTIKKILSKLEPSAKNNIVFAITHAMGCCFADTATLPNLRKFFKQEKMEIMVDRSLNVFHFEGYPFKYLATKCTPNKPVQNFSLMKNCWKESYKNCKDMVLSLIHI